MSILLRALLLIACGPLLVPAGFCTCAAAEHHAPEHSDDHDSHDPDCLATADVPSIPPCERADSLLAFDIVAELLVPAPVERPREVSQPVLITQQATSRPLYVYHCALVI